MRLKSEPVGHTEFFQILSFCSISTFWALCRKQRLSEKPLSLCFLVLSSCTRLSIWIQTQWPNRSNGTVHVWTWLDCLLLQWIPNTKESYLTVFVHALSSIAVLFCFFSNHRHRSNKSFWYTCKTINAQIRNVIICVNGSLWYVLFISWKIQHRIAIIAERLAWSIHCLHEPFLLPLVDFEKALLDQSLWKKKK